MAGDVAKITTNHQKIREWVEKRGGQPATVVGTSKTKKPGLLRFKFPDFHGNKSLAEIAWEEFFTKFDNKGLALLYQEKTAEGKDSRFFKFVKRR